MEEDVSDKDEDKHNDFFSDQDLIDLSITSVFPYIKSGMFWRPYTGAR